MKAKYKVGDSVAHVTSGETGVILYVYSGSCVNPTHVPSICPFDKKKVNNPCMFEPLDLYNILTSFDKTVMQIPGFLLKGEPND
jgi:hypothetical protein